MARNEARRQKKLMKKQQRVKVMKKKSAASVPYGSRSSRRKVLVSRNFPIYECLINPRWKEMGLATILISRKQPDGSILFASYLVDLLCLGVKDTLYGTDYSVSEYNSNIKDKIHPYEKLKKCRVSQAHYIIYGAIDYADQFGFKPHEDFKVTQYVLDNKEDVKPCKNIEFGKDGKPFFVIGPHDNSEHIIRQLESTVGEGNFDYMYGGPSELDSVFDDDGIIIEI